MVKVTLYIFFEEFEFRDFNIIIIKYVEDVEIVIPYWFTYIHTQEKHT